MSTETTTQTSNVVDLPPPNLESQGDTKTAAPKKEKASNPAKKAAAKTPAKVKAKSNGKAKAKPAAKAKTASKPKKVAKAVKSKVKRVAGTKAQAQVGKDLFKFAQARAKEQSTKENKVRVAEVIRGYIYAGAKRDGYKEPEQKA